jgi:dihydrodipicolinate reductase
MIKAVVTGAAGRMGSRIINVLSTSEGIRLSGAVERKGHALVGQDSCGPAGLPAGGVLTVITDDLAAALKTGDVLIDFTSSTSAPAPTSASPWSSVQRASRRSSSARSTSTSGKFPVCCRRT